ncbi:MAG: serine/threonine protein kinase, partial [Planctomycetes bacterium]|nr:serine/threonine protein kinase [Planctomycetota bacterium]
MSDSDTRVADLVENFLDLKRTGRAPDVESFARRHPDVAPRLREALQGLAAVEEAALRVREEPGATIGDYRIAREIGRGGMGVVYEAEDTKLKRRVALKVLPAAALLDPRHLQRFRHEAQAAA